MSVITFVNNIEEHTGKTMALAAIATNMAIDNNNRILVISTTDKEDKMKSCFFEEQQVKKLRLGIFGENKSNMIDTESGIEGIAKIIRSNKLSPELVTNYTRVVFKDRLEIIFGKNSRKDEKKENYDEYDEEERKKIEEEYIELINVANLYYDKIFIDLDNNINEKVRNKIVEMSDLVIETVSQSYNSIKKLQKNMETSELLMSPKSLILIGKYDKFSKYNSKNITRFLGEKNQVLTMPYNTLFFEAVDEAGVPDLLMNLKKMSDSEDKNMFFLGEVNRATQNIIYRLQELQMKM